MGSQVPNNPKFGHDDRHYRRKFRFDQNVLVDGKSFVLNGLSWDDEEISDTFLCKFLCWSLLDHPLRKLFPHNRDIFRPDRDPRGSHPSRYLWNFVLWFIWNFAFCFPSSRAYEGTE